jgi:hypothetical protein
MDLKLRGVLKAVVKFVVYIKQIIDILRRIVLHEVRGEIGA